MNGIKVLPQFTVAPHKEVMEAIALINKPLMRAGMDFGFVDSYNALLRLAVDHEKKILYIYWDNDLAFALDGLFVGLNAGGGIATANPLPIVSAFIKSSAIIKKLNSLSSIKSRSLFDVNVDKMLGLQHSYSVNVNQIVDISKTFDFMYKDKHVSF